MRHAFLFFMLAFTSFSVFGIEKIDRLLVEKAVSSEEKKAIHNYLIKEAQNKRKMAAKFRNFAAVKRGGKATTQINHQKEMIEEAESLESSAKDYEELAKKLKN